MNEKLKPCRDHEIRILCENGKTDAEVADTFGISRTRVMQIRKAKQYDGEFAELSTNTRHCLFRKGIKTKEELIKSLEEGVYVYRIGEKGKTEIEKLTGRKIKWRKKQVTDRICGHEYAPCKWFLIFEGG